MNLELFFVIASQTILACLDFTPTTTLEVQVLNPCWKEQQNRQLLGRTQSSRYPGLALCHGRMPLTVHCRRTVRSQSDPHSKNGPNPEGCDTFPHRTSSHLTQTSCCPFRDFLLFNDAFVFLSANCVSQPNKGRKLQAVKCCN